MDANANTPNDAQLAETWGAPMEAVVCERCDWSYLLPGGSPPGVCPHCFQANLTPMSSGVDGLPYIRPPELLLPFTLSPTQLAQSVQQFASGIPFAPPDLNPKALQSRLRRLYLPMWLVDADVQASWQAEAGFNYQVVSHQDRFEEYRGGWSSQEVQEQRVRWEPRQGRLQRRYENVAAPALEEEQRLKSALGQYDLAQASRYQAEAVSGAYVRLPNRVPQDAWGEAKPAFQAVATEECRLATSADHMRQFQWQPEYLNQNWTLLLQPLYTTFYQDDEGKPQVVLVHGRSGKISGVRRASMKRGQRAALILLAVAIVLFMISVLVSATSVMLPVLMAVGVLGLVIALVVGLCAIFPLLTVWWFNRQ